MLDDRRRPLEPGDTVRLQLTFERAGTITVDVEVVAWDDAVDRLEADPAGTTRERDPRAHPPAMRSR
jgi:copper(I)-binding protein